jgi:phosphatidylglycerophosphate synthase
MKSDVGRRSLRVEGAGRLTISDWLTLFRLVSVPILWIVALIWRDPFWAGIGAAVAAFTDVLDGPIARHSHRTTRRGSRLDSIADHLLTFSIAAWVIWFRPAFIAEQYPVLAAWAIVGVAALLVGWVRFRRIGDLHLYSAKVAGALMYLFALWLLIFGTYNETIFYVVMATLFIGSGGNLLVVSTRKSVDEHVGSILLPARDRSGGAEGGEREGRRG